MSQMRTRSELWRRFQEQLFVDDASGFRLDVSRMDMDDASFTKMRDRCDEALGEMRDLEKGGVANPTENRMVGHYWLRDPQKAPSREIATAIEDAQQRVKAFAKDVHQGKVKPEKGLTFECLLVIGIGGSTLGPQFVSDALGSTADKMKPWFFDNTDPDGMDRVLAQIDPKSTLTIVVSKSGSTKETRNGMIEAQAAYKRAGLDPGKHFVAITGEGSELDQLAQKEGWIARFPMWDWVGGRTSEMSAVGLLPAALQGLDTDSMLAGARAMDALTRADEPKQNPALILALAWHKATGGKGEQDMVVLPYKDRLLLFSRYLQQLVMESLGKEKDRDGEVARQGIAVYGNKGSTDQHAYVQQLRDGVPNFFATFIEVRRDRSSQPLDVEPGVTSGDFMSGFLQGTRAALTESGRESITITIDDVTPASVGALIALYENGRKSIMISIEEVNARSVGMLIALYERAVGFYATFVNINAYDQPGVEAGKQAATQVLDVQKKTVAALSSTGKTAVELAAAIEQPDEIETVWSVLEHLVANGRAARSRGKSLFEARYIAK